MKSGHPYIWARYHEHIINTTPTNRHIEPADKCPSFQTYQVMLVESGHKVILKVSNLSFRANNFMLLHVHVQWDPANPNP